jgi:hypothetical protein
MILIAPPHTLVIRLAFGLPGSGIFSSTRPYDRCYIAPLPVTAPH